MIDPAISIILPVYNSEKYIAECVNSMLNQTFTDFELIVIDDASSDNTFSILEKFENKDDRVFLIKNEENIGITKSLNRGIEEASGKYIARQDADDSSFPTRLERQYEFLERNPCVELVGTSCIDIDENGEPFGTGRTMISGSDALSTMLEFRNYLIHTSIMFRNTGWKYRSKFYYAQDYDLYLRMIDSGEKIANINKPLVKSRQHPSTISNQSSAQQSEFGRLALSFHNQRAKMGDDKYNEFDMKSIMAADDDDDGRTYSANRREMIISLRNGNKDRALRALHNWREEENPSTSSWLLYYIIVLNPYLYRIIRTQPRLYKVVKELM